MDFHEFRRRSDCLKSPCGFMRRIPVQIAVLVLARRTHPESWIQIRMAPECPQMQTVTRPMEESGKFAARCRWAMVGEQGAQAAGRLRKLGLRGRRMVLPAEARRIMGRLGGMPRCRVPQWHSSVIIGIRSSPALVK